MIKVIAFQHNGAWHLKSSDSVTEQVYMLLTFKKLIDLLDAACMLQLRIDNELPLNQYYLAFDSVLVFELVS